MIAYSVGKGALEAFTLSLAKGLGPRGITVNSVCPGVILTRNNKHLMNDPEAAAQQAERVALGRLEVDHRPDHRRHRRHSDLSERTRRTDLMSRVTAVHQRMKRRPESAAAVIADPAPASPG